jgi:hypothetical protein
MKFYVTLSAAALSSISIFCLAATLANSAGLEGKTLRASFTFQNCDARTGNCFAPLHNTVRTYFGTKGGVFMIERDGGGRQLKVGEWTEEDGMKYRWVINKDEYTMESSLDGASTLETFRVYGSSYRVDYKMTRE